MCETRYYAHSESRRWQLAEGSLRGHSYAVPGQECPEVEMSSSPRRKRRRFGGFFLVPVLLAVAGCMVGPNFQRPKATVSTNWLESGDPRLSPEPATYRNWWNVFNDPVLDRLIEHAYRENLPLRSA